MKQEGRLWRTAAVARVMDFFYAAENSCVKYTSVDPFFGNSYMYKVHVWGFWLFKAKVTREK